MEPSSDWTHAGGVVFRPGPRGREYLIVRASRTGDWVLPKGHIEPGERPEDAAMREVREEGAVEADVVAPLGDVEFDSGAERVRARFFLMRGGESAPTDESRDPLWLSFDEARARLTFGETRRLLERAEAYLR